MAESFSEEAQQYLLRLARRTLIDCVAGRLPPVPAAEELPSEVLLQRACFATLMRGGDLRGCIGQLQAREPLWKAIVEATMGAALRDPRFPPVRGEEVSGLRIELSVLGEAKLLRYVGEEDLVKQIRTGVDGVILTVGGRTSTFLPKVWKKIGSPVQFLEQLSLKAGFDRGAWKREDALISVYPSWDFSEAEA